VYAALNGVLTISGTTTTQGNTDVIFTDVTSNFFGSAFVEPEFEVSADGHSITFSADLTEPGQQVTMDYTIENIGSTNARVYAPTFTYDESKFSVSGINASTGNEIILFEGFTRVASGAASDENQTLAGYANYLGLYDGEYITEQTTDDYITIVPGATIQYSIKPPLFQWRKADTALPPGEYEATININYEAAT
jgi:archaellum component FlaF (FlaF/FlaG flagellin family)